MNNTYKSVIGIIYSAVTGKKTVIPGDFDLSDGIKIAKRHRIETMFYYGLINCGVSKDDPFMQSLFVSVCKNYAISEQQMLALDELFGVFDKKEIEYMPLKGTLLKKLYPNPEMRSMGDADILIKTEQLDAIKQIMQDLGYLFIEESNHEYIFNRQNVLIELHKRLIPSYNKDYYAYFGDGWQLGKIKKGSMFLMTNEDQMIYLFTHFAKHYRDAGIGIRHIVDFWVYMKSNQKPNEEYIKMELKKLQLYEFYVNVMNTISVWFDDGKPNAKTEMITKVIFNSGVYGRTESQVLSKAVKTSKSAKNSKLKRTFNIVFLPYKNMCKKYPVLTKAPVLLPAMWIYRIVTVPFLKPGSVSKQINKVKMISDKQVEDYNKDLNFVGLDFNFKE